jgi:hypothetical protein
VGGLFEIVKLAFYVDFFNGIFWRYLIRKGGFFLGNPEFMSVFWKSVDK